MAARRDACLAKWKALTGALQAYRDHLAAALEIHSFNRYLSATSYFDHVMDLLKYKIVIIMRYIEWRHHLAELTTLRVSSRCFASPNMTYCAGIDRVPRSLSFHHSADAQMLQPSFSDTQRSSVGSSGLSKKTTQGRSYSPTPRIR